MRVDCHSASVPSFKRLFGGEVDPVLRPVLASVGFGALGQFAFFAFFAIWALTERDAPATQVGLAYTCSGLAAVAGSLVGGRLSDRIGRQPVIVAASIVQTATPAVLLVPDLPILAAYGVLVVMGFSQPVRGTSQRALLADLIDEEGREEAYGAFRVVLNAGATFGPLLGAALVTWRWEPLFAGIVGAYALSLVAALRLHEGARRADTGGAAPSLRPLARDAALLTVFFAAIGGWCSYAAFELLLPISLTQTHGLAPATWGLLFALNPIVIVLLQMRIMRWTTRIPRGTKLAAGVLLMASPYLAARGERGPAGRGRRAARRRARRDALGAGVGGPDREPRAAGPARRLPRHGERGELARSLARAGHRSPDAGRLRRCRDVDPHRGRGSDRRCPLPARLAAGRIPP